MNQPQPRVDPIQVVVDAGAAPRDDLRVAVRSGMTGVIDRRRFFDRKDMDQARMGAASFQNLSHPIFLPKVLPHDHFDLHAVLPRQPDDVLPHLTGNRLGKPRQIPRANPRLLHRHQQRSRMRHVDECPVQDHSVETPQLTCQLFGVTSPKVVGSFGLQSTRWLSKRGHAQTYRPLWFWLCQVRTSDLGGWRRVVLSRYVRTELLVAVIVTLASLPPSL